MEIAQYGNPVLEKNKYIEMRCRFWPMVGGLVCWLSHHILDRSSSNENVAVFLFSDGRPPS